MIGNIHPSFIFLESGKGRPDCRFFVCFFCVFVSYRYNAKINFTEGRCPGSKAMVCADDRMTSATVPNVNIGDSDYTIAFWTRLLGPSARAHVSGWSRSGKLLHLLTGGKSIVYCHEVSVTYIKCV